MEEEMQHMKIYPFSCEGLIDAETRKKQVQIKGLLKVDVPEDLAALPTSVLGKKWSEVYAESLDKLWQYFSATSEQVNFIDKQKIIETLNRFSFGAFGRVEDVEISFYSQIDASKLERSKQNQVDVNAKDFDVYFDKRTAALKHGQGFYLEENKQNAK